MILQQDRQLRQQARQTPRIAGEFQTMHMQHIGIDLVQQGGKRPGADCAATLVQIGEAIVHALAAQSGIQGGGLDHRYLHASTGDSFGDICQRWPMREYLLHVQAIGRGNQIQVCDVQVHRAGSPWMAIDATSLPCAAATAACH